MKFFLTITGSIMIAMGLIGCIGCDSKPPKRAYQHKNAGLGMQYHYVIFEPSGELSHSLGCTKYEYVPLHIYVDDIGNVSGDSIVWKNPEGNEVPFGEQKENEKNIILSITKDKIRVSGFLNGYKNLNGTYQIETSSPDSWGVSIGGNW